MRPIARGETFRLQDELVAAGIRSVVFAPLISESRVIGILGAYSHLEEHLSHNDTGFFRLAAELVASAIENARACEAVQELMNERSRFMLRVAHNMRDPPAASISMLEVVRAGYLGETARVREKPPFTTIMAMSQRIPFFFAVPRA